jgi:hypothetical protein
MERVGLIPDQGDIYVGDVTERVTGEFIVNGLCFEIVEEVLPETYPARRTPRMRCISRLPVKCIHPSILRRRAQQVLEAPRIKKKLRAGLRWKRNQRLGKY